MALRIDGSRRDVEALARIEAQGLRRYGLPAGMCDDDALAIEVFVD